MPKKILTAATVATIKPPKPGQPQLEVFDRGFPGLFLRVSYGGGRSFVHAYRINGKLIKRTLGQHPVMTLGEAREAWIADRRLLAEGKDPQAPAAKERFSFEAVAKEWMLRDQTGKSRDEVQRVLDRDILPRLWNMPIDDIRKADILQIIYDIQDRGSHTMARRTASYLRRMFQWAAESDIIPTNPLAAMPDLGSETIRSRKLTDGELAQVWEACAQIGYPFGHLHRLLILTGARLEEISDLRWSEIKGDIIELAGSRTKSGQPHSIPISKMSADIIATVPRFSTYLFSTNRVRPVSGFSKAKQVLDSKSGVTDWRTHDLRRTMASGMQRLGVQERVIEAVLGHSTASRNGLLRVYQQHDFSTEKRAALELWAGHVESLIKSKVRAYG